MRFLIISCILILSIFSSSSLNISQELNALETKCCCEKNCECSHEKSTKTIIRNIKCGDNIPAIVSPFSSKQLISNIQNTFKESKTVLTKRNLINFKPKLIQFSIDPPPPKALT